MANLFLRSGRLKIVNRNIDLITDTIKAMLVDDTYVPNEGHTFIDNGGASDPVDKELVNSGYSRQALAAKALADTGSAVVFTADALDFGAIATGTQTKVGAVVLFKDTGTPTTSPVIGVYDVTDLILNGSHITFAMPTPGFLTF